MERQRVFVPERFEYLLACCAYEREFRHHPPPTGQVRGGAWTRPPVGPRVPFLRRGRAKNPLASAGVAAGGELGVASHPRATRTQEKPVGPEKAVAGPWAMGQRHAAPGPPRGCAAWRAQRGSFAGVYSPSGVSRSTTVSRGFARPSCLGLAPTHVSRTA